MSNPQFYVSGKGPIAYKAFMHTGILVTYPLTVDKALQKNNITIDKIISGYILFTS